MDTVLIVGFQDNMGRPWTPEDDQILRDQYFRGHSRELAKLLCRSKQAICNRASFLGIKSKLIPLLDRLLAKTNKNGDTFYNGTACWIWFGNINPDGYGQIHNTETDSNMGAHRAAYVLFKGPIPDGLTIDHLCRRRNCVNPEHLECVSSKENTLRGFGPGAINARKDECIRGHTFTEENTLSQKGGRLCKTCNMELQREHQRKLRRKMGRKIWSDYGWSTEEMSTLQELYPMATKQEIITRLNKRTWKSILDMANRLGIRRTRDEWWSNEEKQYLMKYYINSSKDEIMKSLADRTWQAIQKVARSLGLFKQSRRM